MRWGWLTGDFLLAALEQAMAARRFSLSYRSIEHRYFSSGALGSAPFAAEPILFK